MTPPCQITQNGGWPSHTSDQIRKSPTGCAILKSQISASPHQKVRRPPGLQIGCSLPLFPLLLLRPPFPWGMVSKGGPCPVPRPRERVSKGRGPQPSPFVPLGVQGEVETPWCFSSGVWGGFFSRKECAPCPCGGNRPPREQEAAKGHPGSAAYSCTGDRPAPGSARRWEWRGCGCLPPPRSGW